MDPFTIGIGVILFTVSSVIVYMYSSSSVTTPAPTYFKVPTASPFTSTPTPFNTPSITPFSTPFSTPFK